VRRLEGVRAVSVREAAQEMIGKEVDALLAYRAAEGATVPHLFTSDDIARISEVPSTGRYPIAAIARRLQEADPGIRLGVVVRGCDERAMVELAKQGQVDMSRITLLGVACDEELAGRCGCPRPYPTEIVEGSKFEGETDVSLVEKLEELASDERLSYWMAQFGSCIKCFGCRNICPLCYCKECALSEPDLVTPGQLPPAEPMFHLIRAVDMAGRCVDCGLCEDACPVGIPLRTLYRKVGEIVSDNLGYRPGLDPGDESPLALLGTEKDVEGATELE
jgi:formate dehydrogenase (coenzyme F420) beta subunit